MVEVGVLPRKRDGERAKGGGQDMRGGLTRMAMALRQGDATPMKGMGSLPTGPQQGLGARVQRASKASPLPRGEITCRTRLEVRGPASAEIPVRAGRFHQTAYVTVTVGSQ